MKQKGFTLIEMIVTIMLLAILATTAIPKFINLSDEAKSAALSAFANNLTSQGMINYSGYQLSGLFNFGVSAPATSSKVISLSSPNTGACMLILMNQFTGGINSALVGAALPGGISITQDRICGGTGGISSGQAATCTVFNTVSTYIRASATIPCTD